MEALKNELREPCLTPATDISAGTDAKISVGTQTTRSYSKTAQTPRTTFSDQFRKWRYLQNVYDYIMDHHRKEKPKLVLDIRKGVVFGGKCAHKVSQIVAPYIDNFVRNLTDAG